MFLYCRSEGVAPITDLGVRARRYSIALTTSAGVALETFEDDSETTQLARLQYDGRTAQATPLPPDGSAVDRREGIVTATWAIATLGAGVYQATFALAGEARNYWLAVEETAAGPILYWLTEEPDEAEDMFLDYWRGTRDPVAMGSWRPEEDAALRLPAPVAT